LKADKTNFVIDEKVWREKFVRALDNQKLGVGSIIADNGGNNYFVESLDFSELSHRCKYGAPYRTLRGRKMSDPSRSLWIGLPDVADPDFDYSGIDEAALVAVPYLSKSMYRDYGGNELKLIASSTRKFNVPAGFHDDAVIENMSFRYFNTKGF